MSSAPTSPLLTAILKRKTGKVGMWLPCSCDLYPNEMVIHKGTKDEVEATVGLSPLTTVTRLESSKPTQFVVKDDKNELHFETDTKFATDVWMNKLKTLTFHNAHLTMNDFNIIKVLGSGYYGKVLLVEHKETKHLFALKTIRKSHLISEKKLYTVYSERNILIMSHHPFIVSIRFAFQNDCKFYLGLEYVTGGELFKMIQNGTPVPWQKVRFYVMEVALALKYLHSIGIVYRDLKLENVLLCEDGHIKLTDFGLSKCLTTGESEQCTTTTFCGTTEYLAPEIVLSQSYDFEIDWWQLGIFTYEFCYTVTPFYDKSSKRIYHKIVNEEPVFPKGADPNLVSFVKMLLVKDPKKRAKFDDIKDHPFFGGISWDDVLNKRITPPTKPSPKKKNAKHSSSRRKKVRCDSDATMIGRMDDFDGFSFTGDY